MSGNELLHDCHKFWDYGSTMYYKDNFRRQIDMTLKESVLPVLRRIYFLPYLSEDDEFIHDKNYVRDFKLLPDTN